MRQIGIALFSVMGPATWIINLIDTWTSGASVLVKILLSLTIDAFLAMIWPITWLLWLGEALVGHESSLTRLF